LKVIGELAAQGVTMIMTTHDPNHALQFPGRVVMMKPGGIIAVGPAAEVITDAELTATYGIDIAVLTVARRLGPGEIKFCSPW
jgi:iron complex transport system ATP-binding protein